MDKDLNGILNLLLLSKIAENLDQTQKIISSHAKKIICYLKENNKSKNINSPILQVTLENQNILNYSKYIDSYLSINDINGLIGLLDEQKQNEIKILWKTLLKFKRKSEIFEEDFSEALSKSYFEYFPFEVYFNPNIELNKYKEELGKSQSIEIKTLFNGCRKNTILQKLEEGIKYPKKSTLGMGIYFSESLDYTSFFGSQENERDELGNYGNILPLQKTFTCIGAEIYYDKTKLKNIYDNSPYIMKLLEKSPTNEDIKKYYSDKIVEKNGIHLGKIELESGHILKEEQAGLKRYKGKFIGKEYVITEKEQILPLFGFNFKRSEYVVIWKDRNFTRDNKNTVLQLIEEGITNIYTETSLEKSLELIKRKKYNKIILISNVGSDGSGKKFVEIARKILGYNIAVLFYTGKKKHFEWIKDFPNSLGTIEKKDLFEYIEKYNSLLDLKKKLSASYKKEFNLDDNYFNYLNSMKIEGNYNNFNFDNICPNFRKVIIKSKKNKKVLTINKDKTVSFISYENLDIDSVIFYVTIIDNKITLNSNGFYLNFDEKENIVKGDTSLKEWQFEEINQKYFIYWKKKNNVLTFSENNPIIKEENENKQNQLFDLIDIIEE